MTSLTSVFTFFILVLFNGCFTVPILDQELLPTTFSSLNNEFTSPVVDNTVTPLVDVDYQHSPRHHTGLDLLESSTNSFNENKFDQSSTIWNDRELTTQSTTNFVERFYNDVSSTTTELTTDFASFIPRSLKNDLEISTQTEPIKQQILPESTTVDMISSTVSKNKYRGHLKYDNEEDEHVKNDYDSQTDKYKYSNENQDSQYQLTATKKSHIQKDDQLQEDTTIPTAVFDQQALSQILYIPNDILALDENDSVIVTDNTKQFSTTTILSSIENKPLNQGEKSLHSEEKESNY